MSEKDFVRELHEFLPDVILADYELPTYNGSLALQESKRSCPDVPFILVTGAMIEDLAIEIFNQGASDYVLKNRLQQKLAPAVRRALAEVEEQKARKKAESELHESHRNLEALLKIRTAELRAEMAVRQKIEATLRENESRERNRIAETQGRAKELMKLEETVSSSSNLPLPQDKQRLLQELQIYQI